jgi:ABC-type lipoprotein release transport system permease subunit
MGLSYPLVEGPISRYLEESMELAPLQVPTGAALSTVLLGAVLAAFAAGIPAYRAAKLPVVDSLRNVD